MQQIKYTYFAMLFAQHPVATICYSKIDWMQDTNTMPHSVDHITFISTEAGKTFI